MQEDRKEPQAEGGLSGHWKGPVGGTGDVKYPKVPARGALARVPPDSYCGRGTVEGPGGFLLPRSWDPARAVARTLGRACLPLEGYTWLPCSLVAQVCLSQTSLQDLQDGSSKV